jgi:hypothetical protein
MLAQAELTLPVPAAAPAVPPFALLQSREAYQKTCIKNGVPVPPNWGAAGWKEAGVVGAPFIENPQKAGLWYFKGTAPAGICLGLPRYDNVANPTTKLFGIICMGEKKIKDANAEDRVGACFWDWDDKPNPIPLTGQKVPLTNFAAGAELGLGGICSDCHAGENAFVVHPDDATFAKFDGVTLPSLDAKAWYLPIGLKAAWPKNLFPTTTEAKLGEAKLDQKTEGSCLSCHRLPEISKPDAKIKDYCSTVLSQAVQGGTDNGTVIRKTMPPLDAAGMADTLDYSQHIGKLNDLCKAAMGVGFLPP